MTIKDEVFGKLVERVPFAEIRREYRGGSPRVSVLASACIRHAAGNGIQWISSPVD